MLVRDHPLTGDLAKADGRAHPDIALFSASSLSGDPVETMTKGQVSARSNAQVANLVADGTLEGGKPVSPVLSICRRSFVLQWRRDVEDENVLCVMGHESIEVLGA